MKLSEAFRLYEKTKILAAGKSPKTYENYVYAGKSVIAYFGDKNVKRVTLDEIAEYGIALQETHAPDTVRLYLMCLRTIIKFARKRGIKTVDPDEIVIPKRSKKEPKFLSEEEVAILVEVAGRSKRGYSDLNRLRNVLLVKMLFVSGLRIGELCALNREDIVNRQFYVVGKSKTARPCYITEEVEALIEEYLHKRADDSDALFISDHTKERMTEDTARDVFRRLSKESGVNGVHPHTMRHSYGTLMIDRGVDIRYVATLLGHQSLTTTQKYTHVRDARLRAVYENAMA